MHHKKNWILWKLKKVIQDRKTWKIKRECAYHICRDRSSSEEIPECEKGVAYDAACGSDVFESSAFAEHSVRASRNRPSFEEAARRAISRGCTSGVQMRTTMWPLQMTVDWQNTSAISGRSSSGVFSAFFSFTVGDRRSKLAQLKNMFRFEVGDSWKEDECATPGRVDSPRFSRLEFALPRVPFFCIAPFHLFDFRCPFLTSAKMDRSWRATSC